ncbi:hypothetical protein OS493_020035 [Desmophyllum pertusum]|uniref:Uncharacterized protein n=1 Tax=Desmophyllum pertusum TaxID=174260 RepID=A0A9W9YEP5_9CNID|nr:hypothetical protein OS493_020035 [Desmophyllum pertusum]
MEFKKEMELQKAKTTLEIFRRSIEGHKPWPPDVKRLNPSDISACKMIQYFKRMNKTIKENFREFLRTPDEIITLEEAGKCGPPYDNVLGNYWHKFLRDRIKGNEIEEKKVADSLFREVKSEFGIELLDSDFPLYGYMHHYDGGEEMYFWKRDADAIGWYYNERREQYELRHCRLESSTRPIGLLEEK